MNMRDLAGRHKGQTCIVLGAGPSLRHVADDVLKNLTNCFTITVNSAILKLPHSDYWLSDDQDTRNWSYFTNQVMQSCVIKLMDKGRLGRCVPDSADVVKYAHQPWPAWYNRWNKQFDIAKASFSLNPELPLLGTRTSAGTAVHVARIMGASRVVLLGCDCSYEDQYKYFWQFPGWIPPTRRGRDPCPNRLITDDADRVVSDIHCEEILRFWDALNVLVAETDMIIQNGSGGILEVFPMVDIRVYSRFD